MNFLHCSTSFSVCQYQFLQSSFRKARVISASFPTASIMLPYRLQRRACRHAFRRIGTPFLSNSDHHTRLSSGRFSFCCTHKILYFSSFVIYSIFSFSFFFPQLLTIFLFPPLFSPNFNHLILRFVFFSHLSDIFRKKFMFLPWKTKFRLDNRALQRYNEERFVNEVFHVSGCF